jgi:hypothetical protein
VKSNHYWWTGLYFDKTGNKWRWIDDGVETDFTNWYTGQPNQYRDNEVGMSVSSFDSHQRKWFDDPQKDNYFFYICKKKL